MQVEEKPQTDLLAHPVREVGRRLASDRRAECGDDRGKRERDEMQAHDLPNSHKSPTCHSARRRTCAARCLSSAAVYPG